MSSTRVRVGKSPVHGRGVFAEKNFRRGEKIGTFSGRPAKNLDHKWVLFYYDDNGEEKALLCGSPFRYINHADGPNARIFGLEIYTLRAIKKGDEILINYGG